MRNLIISISIAVAFAIVHCAHAQDKKSVVIGNLISRPNAILILNPLDGDQGFLLPQLRTSQRISINPVSPDDDGLMVFDVDEKSFYYWKENAWVKGLGNEEVDQLLNYDVATRLLSLSNGGQVDLSSLKEIPDQTGHTGKYLTTDGVTLSWASIAALGDITGIIAGQGLSGGAAAGDASLSVNTDGTTIAVNGANALELADGAVTTQKLAPGAVGTSQINSGGNDKILATDPSGVVTWIDRATLTDDNQNLSLLPGNILNIDDAAGADLNALTAGGQIAGPLNNLVIANDAVTATQLANDAVQANELADNSVDAGAIQNGAVTNAKLASNAVAPNNIIPGANNRILTTDGSGTVVWADAVAIDTDDQTLALTGNNLSISEGNSVLINAGGEVAGPLDNLVVQNNTITAAKLADDAVDNSAIVDGAVDASKIASGGINRMLTTDGTGLVMWADQSALLNDNQNLTLSGNTLSIEDGNAVDFIAAGQVAGDLDNLEIQPDAVNETHIQTNAVGATELADNAVDGGAIQAGAVTSSHIADGTVATGDLATGGNDKVLTTDGSGIVTWAERISFADDNQDLTLAAGNILNITDGTAADLNALNAAGQVAGPLNNLVIQPDAVSSPQVVDGSIATADLANSAVDGTKLASDAVTSTHIDDGTVATTDLASGGNDKVLTTDGSGAVTWADRITFTDDNQDLTLAAGNILNITDGTSADLNALSATGQVAGPLNNLVIQPDAVSSSQIVDGTILTTDLANNAVDGTKLAGDAVTSAHIDDGTIATGDLASGGNDKVLTTDGAGAVTWADRITFTDDNQDLTLAAGNILNITDGTSADLNALNATGQVAGPLDNLVIQPDAVSSSQIVDGTVATADLANSAVDGSKLAGDAVTSTHIDDGTVATTDLASGGNDKVLTTDGSGAVTWVDRVSFTDDNQDLTLAAGNILNITDGTSADLNALNASGQVAGPLNNLVIQPDAVSSSQIVDGTIATGDLANSAVDGTKLAGDAVTSAHIDDGTVATADLASGGNDKVLTTDGSGAVTWADRITFTDDNQDLTLAAGNILNITDGTSADLNALAATGQVAGPLNNLVIQPDAVSSSQIVDGTVATADLANGAVDGNKLAADAVTGTHVVDGAITTLDIQDNTIASNDILDESLTSADILNETIASADILNGSIATVDLADKAVTTGKIQQGTSNQILATNAPGTDAVWIDPTALPSTGDVTGTLGTTTVARIQGRNVTNTAPNVGDALIWNGTAWVPSVVTPSPTTQFYSVDPLSFQGSGSPITTAINLPDGATVTAVTLYYQYTLLLGTITATISRKAFATGNIQTVASGSSPLLGGGIQSTGLTVTGNNVVNNATYSYRIEVSFTLPATQFIHGIRIQYSK